MGIVHKLGPGSENGRVKVGDRVGIKASVRCRMLGTMTANSQAVDCLCVWSLSTLS